MGEYFGLASGTSIVATEASVQVRGTSPADPTAASKNGIRITARNKARMVALERISRIASNKLAELLSGMIMSQVGCMLQNIWCNRAGHLQTVLSFQLRHMTETQEAQLCSESCSISAESPENTEMVLR